MREGVNNLRKVGSPGGQIVTNPSVEELSVAIRRKRDEGLTPTPELVRLYKLTHVSPKDRKRVAECARLQAGPEKSSVLSFAIGWSVLAVIAGLALWGFCVWLSHTGVWW